MFKKTQLTFYAFIVIIFSVILTKTFFELGAAFPNPFFIHSEVQDADSWDHPGRREYTESYPIYFFEFLGFVSMLLTPWVLGYIFSRILKIKLLHIYIVIMMFVPYYLLGIAFLYPNYKKKIERSEDRNTIR
ncbi:MAG: hypothetical protein J7604_07655 [Sporocytophaga sp.]|uniref:hypothetical protein n=1 Tax=Sporocytophaga sp. TaxID=2231183 RepID=UPI001B0FCBB2|nr:hypothetical protein [Sporocytophaga sp.]MBO9700071.1 hypothetical protein [Sporocytophaga sp.]